MNEPNENAIDKDWPYDYFSKDDFYDDDNWDDDWDDDDENWDGWDE